jgi:uncharacterized protein YjiS (DUF1127 family)
MSFQSRIVSTHALSTAAAPRPGVVRRAIFVLALWRQRVEARRALAQMDARSLRDAGISPAAAAYESGKPFWRRMGSLRGA